MSAWLVRRNTSEGRKIDDYTVTFTFAAPDGLFIQNLATPNGSAVAQPKHYLSQFHKSYADAATLDESSGRRCG